MTVTQNTCEEETKCLDEGQVRVRSASSQGKPDLRVLTCVFKEQGMRVEVLYTTRV